LNGYKEIDDLRDAMMEILDNPAEKVKAEELPEAEKEKVAEPAYVKKGLKRKRSRKQKWRLFRRISRRRKLRSLKLKNNTCKNIC